MRRTALPTGRRSQANHSVFRIPWRRRSLESRAGDGRWCTTSSSAWASHHPAAHWSAERSSSSPPSQRRGRSLPPRGRRPGARRWQPRGSSRAPDPADGRVRARGSDAVRRRWGPIGLCRTAVFAVWSVDEDPTGDCGYPWMGFEEVGRRRERTGLPPGVIVTESQIGRFHLAGDEVASAGTEVPAWSQQCRIGMSFGDRLGGAVRGGVVADDRRGTFRKRRQAIERVAQFGPSVVRDHRDGSAILSHIDLSVAVVRRGRRSSRAGPTLPSASDPPGVRDGTSVGTTRRIRPCSLRRGSRRSSSAGGRAPP